MYLDRSKYCEVPVHDLRKAGRPVAFKVCIYGRTWQELQAEGAKIMRNLVDTAITNMGQDWGVFESLPSDLGPHCERKAFWEPPRVDPEAPTVTPAIATLLKQMLAVTPSKDIYAKAAEICGSPEAGRAAVFGVLYGMPGARVQERLAEYHASLERRGPVD